MDRERGTGRRDWAAAVCWGALVLLFLAVSVQKIWAGDFWGNLRVGEEILANGQLPRVEEWTFTAAGKPLTEVRWLYCVLIAIGWKAGPWLLCIGMAVVLGVMWAVIVRAARRVMESPAALALVGLGLVAGSGRWVLRPELATDLFVAVFLVVLERARRQGRIGWAWSLIGVQVLWANTHSLFVFGPVLAFLFVGAAAAERVIGWPRGERKSWALIGRMALLAVGVTAACWVNPYATRGAMYPLALVGEASGATGEFVGELKSPLSIPIGLWRWDLWACAVLAVAVVATCAVNWRRLGLARLGVVVVALYLGATAQRSASLLAIMGVWAGLMNLVDRSEVSAAGAPAAEGSRNVARALRGVVAAGALAAAWYEASDRAWTDIGVPRETGIGVVEWDVARGAADFIVSSGADPRVFNYMRDGYYLGWRSGGKIKVFINGRTDVFGGDFIREYMNVGAANWDAESEKWGVNTAVLQVRGFEGLIRALMKNPAWVLVYLDHRNLVFVRRRAEQADLIERKRIDPASSWGLEHETYSKAEAWKQGLGGVGRPWYEFGMAQSFLAIGSLGNAEKYLRRTLDRWPDHERAIAELAAIERFDGRTAEGDALRAKLRAGSAWALYSERALEGMLLDAGRRDEALTWMQRAVDSGESDPALAQNLVALGDWHFGQNAFAGARRVYELAVKSGLDSAPEWKKLGYARDKTGDVAGAMEAYKRSLVRDVNQHEVWYLLGLVQAKAGDRGGARTSLEQSLKRNPNYSPARQALNDLR